MRSIRERSTWSTRLVGRWPRWAGAALVLGTAPLTGCDFEVTNPGPVADEFLNDPGAYSALIAGVGRRMNWALNGIAADVAVRTREVMNADANPFEGWSFEAFMGTFLEGEQSNFYDPWEQSAHARWHADDNVRRLTEVLGSEYGSNEWAARANLWAGFAYRLVGEYACDLVIDGGPPLPQSDAFSRAEERFSTAIDIATAADDTLTLKAAYAGRASVRINLDKWSEAVADAAEVDTGFEFKLPYDAKQDWRLVNVYVFSEQVEGGIVTVWNTPYFDYGQQTGDPRTPFAITSELIETSFPLDVDAVPYYPQRKYRDWGDDIDLVTGTEMRLVEAEALLTSGQIDPAMIIINGLRTRVGIDPWPVPVDLAEAWTFFKRERGVELWLEGRRLADYARWKRNTTPGALAPEELGTTNGGPDLSNMALCAPTPREETDLNPNFS